MLLASYFFSARLHFRSIDPLKRGRGPVVSVIFFLCHGTSFLCRVQGWIVRLEHKTLFHGTPTMHLWTPCYAWTTDADPAEGREGFVRASRPWSLGNLDPYSLALPLPATRLPQDSENLPTQTVSV